MQKLHRVNTRATANPKYSKHCELLLTSSYSLPCKGLKTCGALDAGKESAGILCAALCLAEKFRTRYDTLLPVEAMMCYLHFSEFGH